MRQRLRHVLPPLMGLGLFIAALEVLRQELRAVSWPELRADLLDTPAPQLALAVLLTICNYAILTGYDFLAFVSIGRHLPKARIALASFLAYAVANTVGFAMVSGASIRYRFYTRWGITGEELTRIVFLNIITFWLGLLLIGGSSLALSELPTAIDIPGRSVLVPAGWTCVAISLSYIALTVLRRAPLHVGHFEVALPSSGLALAQLGLSTLEWSVAGSVLYVLLPPSALSLFGFLGAFVAAQLLGLVSQVPGGVGVFEGLMVLLLKPFIPSGALLPALIVYRAVYYLVPLAVAAVILIADELHQRREQAARVRAALGQVAEQLTPRVLAALTFFSGLILLFSGATPAAAGRLALLDRLFPLGVIEASHFVGSLVGVILLLLSHALARRLDSAYVLTVCVIVVGIAASVMKGGDYEEAIALAVVLLVLWRARSVFDRRAALFETRFTAGWLFAVAGAISASVWLGLFAFKHVEYANELWWQFAVQGDASRFLRSSVGVAVALLLLGFARLLRQPRHDAPIPTDADLQDAERAIALQTSTSPNLVFLRDKALLFDSGRTAFVMYGVQGRTWVALGDPVGPEDRVGGLVRLFLERCDDFGGVPVFYEVTKAHLHRYADFGLTFVKLGEEARVDLTALTLEGGRGAKYRQAIHRLEREGGVFRIVEPSGVPAIMDVLRSVSDDWLAAKATAEKGFSLGLFDETYLRRFPVAVIERGGRIQAFANLWAGAQRVELSVDLMRYHRDAPKGVMEALFVHLMQWGREQGYHWFTLGMAPLSGFEQSPVAPLWNRIGAFLYEHGEAVYNFQGLRGFKEKFDPTWEPHYLAYPGGLHLPRILADVAALIAGGYRRVFLR